MSEPFVTVIIPVYNDAERLLLCLDALEKQTYPSDRYEVVVIDNSSDEPVAPLVTDFSHAVTTYESQPGSYVTRNKGLSIAKGEVTAFTDSDCIPANDWIEKGVAKLLEVPNCGLVAGRIEVFCKDPARPTAVETYDRIRGFEQKDFLERKHYGATANVFTFKKIFQDVGLFNIELKSGGDKEWGIRVYEAGYNQVYADDVCITHPARYSFRDLYNKVSRITLDIRSKGKYRVLARYYRLLRPPVEELVNGWRNPKLVGIKQKVQYCYIVLVVKVIVLVEHTRLIMGGQQQR